MDGPCCNISVRSKIPAHSFNSRQFITPNPRKASLCFSIYILLSHEEKGFYLNIHWKNVFYDWLILCIVFNIPLQNISFIWRRYLHQQWTAQCRPQLNVHDLETEGVFIVQQLLDTGPRFWKDAPFLLRKRVLPRTYFNPCLNKLIL